jgi:hypothetical protein
MLQDFSCPADQEVEGDMPSIPVVHKSGIRSLKLETQKFLPDCFLNMNGTFGFLTIWDDNKVDVVSTAMAIKVSSSRKNEYVSE